MEVLETNSLDAIQTSVAHVGVEESSLALQSTVATAKKVVGRALQKERVAEEAALSLGQRQRLSHLCSELEEAHEALEQALTDRGRLLDEPDAESNKRRGLLKRRKEREQSTDWDEAVEKTLDSLQRGADLLGGLAQGQRPDTAAYAVATATARLLRDHCTAIEESSTASFR